MTEPKTETLPWSLWQTCFLLHGPGYPGRPRLRDLPAEQQHAIRKFFRAGQREWGRLWQQHETSLRSQAVTLGIDPRWPGQTFFAEHLSRWEARHP